MTTEEKIKKYFSFGIIVVLLLILFFSPRGCKDVIDGNAETITIKTDTVWAEVHDTIEKEVPVLEYKYITLKGEQYTPGDNLDTCTSRFNKVVKELSKRTIYEDVIKLDTLGLQGTLTIKDVIFKNQFEGKRKYISDLKVPTITKEITITKDAEPVRQFYFGANIYGDKDRIQLVTPGILYKDKKDHVYQANIGVNFDGSVTYGAGLYYKISLRKKK